MEVAPRADLRKVRRHKVGGVFEDWYFEYLRHRRRELRSRNTLKVRKKVWRILTSTFCMDEGDRNVCTLCCGLEEE